MRFHLPDVRDSFEAALYVLVTAGLLFFSPARDARAQAVSALTEVPAPTAASLGKYGDVPVSLATGTPTIEVPLHTVESRSLSVPITLTYHASGVRVRQRAGATGLGWSMNAGGVITRVMRGIPDDVRDGYLHTEGFLDAAWPNLIDLDNVDDFVLYQTYLSQNEDYLGGVAGHAWEHPDVSLDEHTYFDPLPDVFLFNFAGHSGKFVIDEYGVHTIPRQMYDITYEETTVSEGSGNITRWIVKTKDGTTYVFDKTERISSTPYTYASAWYLTEVRSASGDDVITFDYTTSHHVSGPDQYKKREWIEWSSEHPGSPSDSGPKSPGLVGKQEVYLDRITSAQGIVDFNMAPRDDVYAGEDMRYYDDLIVKSPSGQRRKRIDLEYGYFNDGTNDPDRERLRLDRVQIYGETDSDAQAPYEFAYYGGDPQDPVQLPAITSLAEDHWGFYNGKDANDDSNVKFIPSFRWESSRDPEFTVEFSGGADRSPDETGQYMQVGTLNRITYPTGGHTTFEYEPHDYSMVGESGLDPEVIEGNPNAESVYDGPYGTVVETREIEVNSDDGTPIEVTLNYRLDSTPADTGDGSPEVSLYRLTAGGEDYVWSETLYSRGEVETGTLTRELSDGTYELRASRGSRCTYCEADLSASWRNRIATTPDKKVAGGLRIKRMTIHDGITAANDIIKEYEYHGNDLALLIGSGNSNDSSSGVLVRKPRYLQTGWVDGTDEFLRAFASDLNAMGTGSHIGYRQVTVRTPETGRTAHFFLAASGEYHGGAYRIASDDVVFVDDPRTGRVYATSRDWKRGLPLLTVRYDANGQKVREVKKEYIFSDTNGSYYNLNHRVRGLNYDIKIPDDPRGRPYVRYYRRMQVISAAVLESAVKTTVYDADGTHVTTTRAMAYEDTDEHLLPTRIIESGTNVETRTTRYEYAHESHAPGMGPGGSHQLSQRYATTVEDASGNPVAKEWTTWSDSWSDGSHFRPKAEWIWRGDGSGSDTGIDDGPTSGCDQQGEVVCTTEYVDYDAYGRPLETESARGQPVVLAYGGPWAGKPFLTGASTTLGGQALTVSYAYDNRGRLSQITDEAGGRQHFDYDGLGRLEAIRNHSGDPVESYTYSYTQGDPSADPSYVETTALGGESPNQITTAYVDGLGRAVQTRTEAGAEAVISARSYDAVGRRHKAFRPYLWDGSGYDADFGDNASAYYEALDVEGYDRPFTETRYKADPLERVAKVHPPGESSVAATTDYGVASFDGETYRYTEQTDEADQRVRTYRDGFGRAVATVADPGGAAATTRFEYDAADNLTKVTRPEEDSVTYAYDRAGRLVEKDDPDAGLARMAYDAAGNLRFSQDANQEADGEVQFTTYDALERPVAAGVAAASFSNLNPDADEAFESDPATWRRVWAYDAKPDAQGYPWDRVDLAGVALDRTAGRLAAEAYRSGAAELGMDVWQIHLYSYDREGRVKAKHMYMEDNPSMDARIEYAYDRQGRLVWRKVSVEGERFYQWYTYNARGLVEKVYASQSAEQPAVPEVSYTYAADGQVSEMDFSGFAPIAYGQTIRGWTEEIDGIRGPDSLFAARYSYLANGNLDVTDYHQPGLRGALQRYRYQHGYDALGRLAEADYSYHDGAGWQGSAAYDVAASYDRNGNLKTLDRYGEGGSLVDALSYTYGEQGAGVNQLTSLGDAAGAVDSWDAGPGTFAYDHSGNLTAAPAPYNLADAVYDESNRPTLIQQADGISIYFYGPHGQRTLKVAVSGCDAPEGCSPVMTGYIRDRAATVGVFEGDDPEDEGDFSLTYWNILHPSGEVLGRIPLQQ